METVKELSKRKNEPSYLLDFRIKAFTQWEKMSSPNWAKLGIPPIDYQNIQYYSKPKTKKKIGSLDEVDPELLRTFEKLGISLNEQKLLTNVAVDAVFDSVSIGTTFKDQLHKYGIIFCSFTEAVELYPKLVEKYLGKVVPINDNYFQRLILPYLVMVHFVISLKMFLVRLIYRHIFVLIMRRRDNLNEL
jgi:Fe-S cluster assembly protein SufB